MQPHCSLVAYLARTQEVIVYVLRDRIGTAVFPQLLLSLSGRSSSLTPYVPYPAIVSHLLRRHFGAARPRDAERAEAVPRLPQTEEGHAVCTVWLRWILQGLLQEAEP